MKEQILKFINTIFINEIIEVKEEYMTLGNYKILFEDFWENADGCFSEFTQDETIIYNSNNFETAIRIENYGRIGIYNSIISSQIEMSDESNGITYYIGKPSIEYLLFLITKLNESNKHSEFYIRYLIRSLKSFYNYSYTHFGEEDQEERDDGNTLSLSELLLNVFRMIRTVKIVTTKSKNIKEFDNYFNSVIFHMGFNLSAPLIKYNCLDELFNYSKRGRVFRRENVIEAPRRLYNKDLVYHYQMALASGISYVEYISYYHVIEHFMEKIYNDEFIASIKEKITDPRFSFNRDKDIKSLIKVVNDHNKHQKEEMIINEREAIRLTLQKYIKTNQLTFNLNEMDSSILTYYEQNEVKFSKGVKIPFSSNNSEEIIKKMTNRIYDTRNALVHSKDSDKSKYVPFEHDDELVKEIPLMRLIAEEIIISNSDIIK